LRNATGEGNLGEGRGGIRLRQGNGGCSPWRLEKEEGGIKVEANSVFGEKRGGKASQNSTNWETQERGE